MKIDLDSIRVLKTIVDNGSFAAAAKKLHRAQSAVSYQIRKLEDVLDLQIFDRSEYRAQLTEAGQAILQEGERLLKQAEQVEALARQLNQQWEPTFEVVIDGILEISPIMRALRALIKEGVPTRISLSMEYLDGVQRRFEQNNADLMLVKDFRDSTHLRTTPLPEIECLLCVSPIHPLAGIKSVELSDLQRYVELLVHDSSEQERFQQHQMHFGSERQFFLSDFRSKKSAMEQGIGYGWMPAYLVADDIAAGRLTEVDYKHGSRFCFTPKLVWRTEKPLGRTATRFIELLQQFLQQDAVAAG